MARRFRVFGLSALFAIFFAATPAHAQLGGLIKLQSLGFEDSEHGLVYAKVREEKDEIFVASQVDPEVNPVFAFQDALTKIAQVGHKLGFKRFATTKHRCATSYMTAPFAKTISSNCRINAQFVREQENARSRKGRPVTYYAISSVLAGAFNGGGVRSTSPERAVSETTVASPAEAPTIYPAISEPEHKPVFHNDRIHIYQVRLQPGERSFYHLHSRDQLGISMADFASANQVLGKEEQLNRSSRGAITFIPHTVLGGTTHRVRAVEGEMWVIGIEFADPAPAGATISTASPGAASFEFPQGRLARIVLRPGESAKVDGELVLAATPGTLRPKAGAENWAFDAGEVRWLDGPPTDYENGGEKPVELLVLDLK